MTVRPLWWEHETVYIVDQTRLPDEYRVLALDTAAAVFEAISTLRVRGAPAIGLCAAFGLVLAMRSVEHDFDRTLKERRDFLNSARPTAVNLSWALDQVAAAGGDATLSPAQRVERMRARAVHLWEEDRAMCHRIGQHGAKLLEGVSAVLTHCNAGALGTAEWGTALAPIYALLERGVKVTVFADETRPVLQGARLTAWELSRAGVEVRVITDSTAAVVLQKGWVGAVVVGADRIAKNGDTANKIGTYGLAVLAKCHNVPFYVAAPRPTFDPHIETGAEIPIEARDPAEVTHLAGRRIVPEGVQALNFAFDVTPAEYISAFITDRGVALPPFSRSVPKLLA